MESLHHKTNDHLTRILNQETGPFVLLKGEAGTGKSYLLQSLAGNFPGWKIHKIYYLDQDSRPLYPWFQLVTAIGETGFATTDAEQETLEAFVQSPGIEKIEQDILFQTLFSIINRYGASRECLIICEDIHWADSTTLRFIDYMLKSPSRRHFALVATARSEDLPAALNAYALGWKKEGHLQTFVLKGLNKKQTQQLAETLLGAGVDRALLSRAFHITQGNPLYLSELLSALRESGRISKANGTWQLTGGEDIPIPQSMQAMVTLKMDKLSLPAQHTLEVAACVGSSFRADHLAALTDGGERIDELTKTGFLQEEGGGGLSFRHQLIRQSVLCLIPWSRRKAFFLSIAQYFEGRPGEHFNLGEYWIKAGEREKGVPHLVRAAKEYCRLYAHKEAIETATLALNHWPDRHTAPDRLALLEMMADCLKMTGELPRTASICKEILKLCDELADDSLRARALRNLASVYALQGAWNNFALYRLQSAQLAEALNEPEEAAKDYLEVTNRHIDNLQVYPAGDSAAKALACALLSGNQTLIIKAKSIVAYTKAMAGNPKEGLELASEAIREALARQLTQEAAYAYRKLAGVLEYASDFRESNAAYALALNYCRREELDAQANMCLSCMSWVLFRNGDWSQALRVSAELIATRDLNDASRATAHLVAGLVRTYRGELKSARMHVAAAGQLAGKANFRLIGFLIDWAKAMLAQALTGPQDALLAFADARRAWQESDENHDILPVLMYAAECYHQLNETRELHAVVALLSELTQRTSNPEALGCFSFALGLSEMADDAAEAIEGLTKSVSYFEQTHTPLQKVTSQYYLALALREEGRTHEALRTLAEAVAKARQMGMRTYAGKLRSLLESLEESRPATSRKALRGAADVALSGRQSEVLQLLADGLSNKEMAVKMNLSVRTVDMHVRNILDLLYCRNRTEAVKAAREKHLIV